MEIRTKLYPYPVLYKKNDDYEESVFEGDADVCIEGPNLRLRFSIHTDNTELMQLIESGKASYVYHLECPATGYRKAHYYENGEEDLLISQKSIRDVFQVCSFIVARQDIPGYTNQKFNSDYKGIHFDIDKGCVLAVGDQICFNIDPQVDDFSNTPSIFNIIKMADPSVAVLHVDLEGEKIRVYLPVGDYSNYNTLKTNLRYKPILNSLIVLPALIYTLEEICAIGAEERNDQYGDYRWYRALRKTLLKMNIDCEDNDFQNSTNSKNMVVYAQKLIGQQTSEALVALRNDVGEED